MDKRLEKIIAECQKLREKFGDDYEVKTKKQREKFSKEIISQKLIEKCGNDKDFAKQLCIINELQYE